MKRLSTALATIALIGTPAFAADIPVKAPPSPPAPPAFNWTGWYVGVNAGASFGNVKTDYNDVAPLLVTNNVGGSATFPAFGSAGSSTTYPDGFMGGGQIGYNWQFSPTWVAGLEADFQGAVERDSNNLSNSFDVASVPGGANVLIGTTAIGYTTKIDWFGTVRGRIGYVWGNGNVFSYVTGGLAYGKVDLEGTNVVSGTLNGVAAVLISQAFGHSQVNTGWVVGYGTEGVIDFWGARNWTWKIEGLYMDLGTLDAGTGATVGGTFPVVGAPGITITSTGGGVTTHSHFTDGILRAGLNYRF